MKLRLPELIKITDNKLQLGFKCKIWYYTSRILLITAFAITHGYQLSSKSQPFYTFISGILNVSCYAVHFCANNGVGYLWHTCHLWHMGWLILAPMSLTTSLVSSHFPPHHHSCYKSVEVVLTSTSRNSK